MKKRSGQIAIDSTVSMLITMALLVLAISVFTVINRVTVLNSMSNEMARYIEIRGSYGSAAANELARLQRNNGMNAKMSFSGSLNGERLQLGSAFTVTLKATANIGVGGIISIPIPIQASATGRGEKLWK